MSDPRSRNDDPDAPVTDQERVAADELRSALEDPRLENDDADLARALSSAWAPHDLSEPQHRALVEQALRRHRRSARSGRVVRMSFAAGAAFALAAGLVLVIGSSSRTLEPSRVPAGLAVS